MKVQELMTTDVITLSSNAPLKEAARRMIEAGVSGLVVTDDAGNIVGVITEADFVKAESDRRADKRALLLRWLMPEPEMPSSERVVKDAMTANVVTLGPGADHAEAARVMRKAGIKRIPIVDREGGLVGIVSRSDILRAFARSDPEIIDEISNHILGDVLWIDRQRVEVGCVEGNVTLKGRLETKSDAMLVEEMARRVDGVVSVTASLTWEIDNTKQEMTSPVPGSYRRGLR